VAEHDQVAPTLDNVLVLGLIVVIRTFLSFSLETKIEGVAPRRRAAIGGVGTIRRVSASALEPKTRPYLSNAVRYQCRSAGTRAPGAPSALTVRARDAHRAVPGRRHTLQPQDRHIAKSLIHGRSCRR